MKLALKQLQKAIAYQKKQQEQIIETQLGLLNARIITLIDQGQTKPVRNALEQIQPMLTKGIALADLRTLSELIEGL